MTRKIIPSKQSVLKKVEITKESRVNLALNDMLGIIECEIVRYQTRAREGGLTSIESKMVRDHTETLLRMKRDQQTSRKNNSLGDMTDAELEEVENAIQASDGDSTDKV